jgi:hypothetical protein
MLRLSLHLVEVNDTFVTRVIRYLFSIHYSSFSLVNR